jgi:hypothetical protein
LSRLQFDDSGAVKTPADLRNLGIPAPQRRDDGFRRAIRHVLVAAGEYVRRRVPQFGPSVDGYVGFGDGEDASHALRRELVKSFPNHVRAHLLGDVQQFLPNILQIIQKLGVAISEFQQHVRT